MSLYDQVAGAVLLAFDALTDETGYATLRPLLTALAEAGVPFVD